MIYTLLEIGCDGGSITIYSKCFNGIFFYEVKNFEIFNSYAQNTTTFVNLNDAWHYLKHSYKKWYRLYLVDIDIQMVDLLKHDYLSAIDKDEYTKDRWLEQLIGKGLDF